MKILDCHTTFGKIVKTAGPELAKEIEARGYDWIKEEVGEK